MEYYGKIISLTCLISVLFSIVILSLNTPVYEFYIDDFEENSDEYSFSLILDGNMPRQFILDSYVGGELVRTTSINFKEKIIFPATISKAILNEGQNKIHFEIYSSESLSKNYGSKEKPYTLHKWVNYEKN